MRLCSMAAWFPSPMTLLQCFSKAAAELFQYDEVLLAWLKRHLSLSRNFLQSDPLTRNFSAFEPENHWIFSILVDLFLLFRNNSYFYHF